MKRAWVVWVACGVVLLSGCSKDAGDSVAPEEGMSADMMTALPDMDAPTESVGAAAAHAHFQGALSRLVCTTLFECPADASLGVLLLGVFGDFNDEADCLERLFQESPFPEDAYASGRVTYDAARAARCLPVLDDFARTYTCNPNFDFEGILGECARVLEGAVASGEACLEDEECAQGLRCEPGAQACHGTCQPPSCGGAVCGAAQFCDFSGDSAACKAMIPNLGDACGTTDECAQGLCLLMPDQTQGVCVERYSVARGGECAEDAHCLTGLICIEGACSDEARDLDIRTLGQPCEYVEFGADCIFGLTCMNLQDPDAPEPMGTCAEHAQAGEACDFSRQCATNHYCAGSGTCAPSKATGEPCSRSVECASSQCDQQLGRCTEDPACVIP